MHFLGLAFAAATCLCIPKEPVSTVYLSESDGRAYLTGFIEDGDETAFAAFLAKPRAHPIRILFLDSEGGKIKPAIAIARAVRKARLDTAVRATRSACESACTLIFAGGVHRYNIDGDTVFEGTTSLRGLGYHPAHLRGDRVHASTQSNEGIRDMAGLYAEMGAPRAAGLMRQAAFNTLYHPSGATTLRFRIATSLREPQSGQSRN